LAPLAPVLLIVKPETVIGWRRAGFRLYWRWRSRARGGRPRITPELRDLIARLAEENPDWGAPKIHADVNPDVLSEERGDDSYILLAEELILQRKSFITYRFDVAKWDRDTGDREFAVIGFLAPPVDETPIA
jgi:hypothetical protein